MRSPQPDTFLAPAWLIHAKVIAAGAGVFWADFSARFTVFAGLSPVCDVLAFGVISRAF
jgi:hypothetical protein